MIQKPRYHDIEDADSNVQPQSTSIRPNHDVNTGLYVCALLTLKQNETAHGQSWNHSRIWFTSYDSKYK